MRSTHPRTALCLSLTFALAGNALADEGEPSVKSKEVSAGVDASSNAWLAYSGATVAPFGGLFETGARLRATLGYGQYRYSEPRKRRGETEYADQEFLGKTAFAEALVGYLYRAGPLTAKAFAGVSIIDHEIAPFDPDNEVQGLDAGLKGVAEFWLNITDDTWASLDLGYTTAHETGSVRMRNGHRVVPDISIGVESILDANAVDMQGRAGAFVRYEWDGGEISGAAGVTGDLPSRDTLDFPTTPYATVNWISQF